MRRVLAAILISFFVLTLPLAFKRPTGGRSAERQGQTAGVIRIYCEEPSTSILRGPHIHYGRNAFNFELPLFEWGQGAAARVLGGTECDAVEPVAKVFAILCSALAVLGLYFLGGALWGPRAGALAAALLATDGLWLRYSTYTMIENRALACAVFAVFFSVRRRAAPAFLLWTLTFVQKPQIFLFASAFWIVVELTRLRTVKPAWKGLLKHGGAYAGAALLGIFYYSWSTKLNAASDLPWVQWTGEHTRKWFFGTWGDRFTWGFFKHLFLDWFRRSGLLIAVVSFLPLKTRGPFAIAAPLLVASAALSFVFHPVFVVHEYYSLPLNVFGALTLAGMAAYCVKRCLGSGVAGALSVLISVSLALAHSIGGISNYLRFAVEVDDPKASHYIADWDRQVFPKKHSLVVMAVPGSGHDLLHLYLTKQRGFMWCSTNPRFAPRAFWKEQGVEYVAWATGQDPVTQVTRWEVRTLEEELKLARSRGWSSDVADVWAGRAMSEWAKLAGDLGKDPCVPGQEDPRNW